MIYLQPQVRRCLVFPVPILLSSQERTRIRTGVGQHQPDELIPNQKIQEQRSHRQSHHPEHHPEPGSHGLPKSPRSTVQREYPYLHPVERIYHENPNMSQEELEKMMIQY